MNHNAYCNFEDTGQVFRTKKVYQCSYCGMKLGLENPNQKVICFKKMQDFTISLKKIDDPDYSEPLYLDPKQEMKDAVLDMAIKKYGVDHSDENKQKQKQNLCTDEQIEARLKICQECEHYKDNSCELCGCVVVREANYMNKLANKDQACPINKWDKIAN